MSKFVHMTLLGMTVLTVSLGSLAAIEVCLAEEPESKRQDKQAEPSKESKQVAQLIAANELMRLHWSEWVTGRELKEIAKETAKGINEQLEIRWAAKVMVPLMEAPDKPLSEFEKQGIDDIRAGVAEVWHKTPDGWHYMCGMRATKSCLQCHRPLNDPGRKLEVGDLLGIISVTLKQ